MFSDTRRPGDSPHIRTIINSGFYHFWRCNDYTVRELSIIIEQNTNRRFSILGGCVGVCMCACVLSSLELGQIFPLMRSYNIVITPPAVGEAEF